MSILDNIRFIFLYVDKYSMGRTWYYPSSLIPYNMLRFITKGQAEFCINDEKILVRENQIVYIPVGSMMSCQALTDTFEFYSIRFTTSVIFESDDILKKYYGVPRITENQGEEIYFQEILKWAKSEHVAKKCFIRGYLNVLIGTLSFRGKGQSKEFKIEENEWEGEIEKLRRREEKSNRYTDPRIQVVVDYILLHPTEKYTPAKMAEMAELSKQRFSSLFKANTGKSPMEYIREIRLMTAARKLLTCNDNVNDIAYSVGYEDANYFIREFKQRFGFTPNQYRKVGQA